MKRFTLVFGLIFLVCLGFFLLNGNQQQDRVYLEEATALSETQKEASALVVEQLVEKADTEVKEQSRVTAELENSKEIASSRRGSRISKQQSNSGRSFIVGPNGEVTEAYDMITELSEEEGFLAQTAHDNLLEAMEKNDEHYAEYMEQYLEFILEPKSDKFIARNVSELYSKERKEPWASEIEQAIRAFFASQPVTGIRIHGVNCRERNCDVFLRYTPYQEGVDISIAIEQLFLALDMFKTTDIYTKNFVQVESVSNHANRDDTVFGMYFILVGK